jgi:drug/metabolite transporter (DMT)-like permease
MIATLFWAGETILVKRLLASVPTGVMAIARMGIGLVVLIGYLAISGKLGGAVALDASAWGWVAVTGVILAAYVGTWFAALNRAPASAVASVLVLGAVITGVLSAIAKGVAPSPLVVGGYVLIVVAGGFLALWTVRTARRAEAARSADGRALA